MCKHEFIRTSWSNVCRLCGREFRVLTIDSYNHYSAPIGDGYSRRFRFKTKIEKLLSLHSGPVFSDPVWSFLHRCKDSLNSPFDVREALRSSKLVNKHYDCVKIFCDAFTTFHVQHSCPLKLREILLHRFDFVFSLWSRHSNGSFFSYDWLIRLFLEEIDSPLIQYLKPKTCRTRNEKYLKNIKQFLNNDKIHCYAKLANHFPSVK